MDVSPYTHSVTAAKAGRLQPSQSDNAVGIEYTDTGAVQKEPESRIGPGTPISGGSYTSSSSKPQPRLLSSVNPLTDPLHDLKRLRACETCRQLKVRCEPDTQNPGGSCRRCAKIKRACVVTLPTRKRQKKADARVAELEKKVDALSASLRAQQQEQSQMNQGYEEYHERRFNQGRLAELAGVAAAEGVDQQERTTEQLTGRRWPSNLDRQNLAQNNKRLAEGETKSNTEYSNLLRQDPWRKEPYDIFSKGVIDVETANVAFERYINDMAPLMPFVVFPAGTRMADIRESKPILLHAIIAVAIGTIQPSAQMDLLQDLYKLIADRVVVNGEKSLELVQAILVSWIWYMPPEHYEELKFYHLVHLGVTIGMDIGMNRRTTTNRVAVSLIRDLIGKKPCSLDPDSPEMRRTWLGCYFGSIHASTSLRRTFLVRWQPYMDECLEILKNSPDALPSDQMVIHMVKLAHISEEVGTQFSTDDSCCLASISSPKTQYALKALERQLLQWRKDIPAGNYSTIIQQSEHVLNIYMHEIAMHLYANAGQASTADRLGLTHINALTTCLAAVEQTIDAVCSTDNKTLLSTPSMVMARTSYAAVTLIKLYALATAPDGKVGEVIDPSSLRVEYHLDKVIRHYSAAGEQAGGKAPAKFALILSLLLGWFTKRKDQNSALREAFGGSSWSAACREETYRGHDERQKITTPLQLLSEAATVGASKPAARSQSQYPARGYSEPIQNGPSIVLSNPATEPGWMQQYQATPAISSISQPGELYAVAQYPTISTGVAEPYAEPTEAGPFTSGVGPWQACFVPELGMQVGFHPENLFALGSMLDEGFFNFSPPGDAGSGSTDEGSAHFYGYEINR